MAKTLYIVSREHPQLYGYLTRRCERDTDAEVIYDRRVGPRRLADRGHTRERRSGDRRQQSIERSLADFGWALVAR